MVDTHLSRIPVVATFLHVVRPRILTTQDTATFQDGVAHHARCWEAKMRRMKKI